MTNNTAIGNVWPAFREKGGFSMMQRDQVKTDHERQVAGLKRHMDRLMEMHEPQTMREVMILTELAQVYLEKEEFERDHRLWMRFEVANAVDTFKRQEAEDFLRLQRQWTKAPAARRKPPFQQPACKITRRKQPMRDWMWKRQFMPNCCRKWPPQARKSRNLPKPP